MINDKKLLGSYQNGNYTVSIYDDGTKIRENDLDFFESEFPESIDLNISNKCDIECPFCYNNSSKDGKVCDFANMKFVDTLHPYTELAMNLNGLFYNEDFEKFLKKLKDKRIIANVTVNQIHFETYYDYIVELKDDGLVHGIGISLVNPTEDFISKVTKIENAVVHVINGIVTVEQLKRLAFSGIKLLILGYKEIGRGVLSPVKDYETWERVEKRKNELLRSLPIVNMLGMFKILSFDNLALKQLQVERLVSEKQWKDIYMGNDGEFTMYVDAVRRTYSKSSLESESNCYQMKDDVKDMFKQYN